MTAPSIVVVGASAGGVEALRTLVKGLPGTFSTPVAVVLHLAPNARSMLSEVLSRAGVLRVLEVAGERPLEASTVYVGPPNEHLIVGADVVRSEPGPKENGHRPSIDVLF